MNNQMPQPVLNTAAIIAKREQLSEEQALQKAIRWYCKAHPDKAEAAGLVSPPKKVRDRSSIESVLRMLKRYDRYADPELGIAKL